MLKLNLGTVVVIAALVLGLPVHAQKSEPAAGQTAKADAVLTELNAIGTLFQSGDTDAATARLDRFIASPDFKTLDPKDQETIVFMKGGVELQLERYTDALTTFRRVTTADPSSIAGWYWRATAANGAEDHGDAALSVIALAGMREEGLATLSDSYISSLASRLVLEAPNGEQLQVRLVDALFDAGWDADASWIWTGQAATKIEQGDTARARALLDKVTDPTVLLMIAVDRRFDSLRAADPEHFDVAEALERDLETLRLAAIAPEATMEDGYQHAYALMHRGRFDEALTVIDGVLARAEPSSLKADVAPADPDEVIWALDTRSRIQDHLGNRDEALASLRRAARRPENGQVNVSHAINLGALYLRLDRPLDALDAVSDVEDGMVSGFGRMQLTQVRACAYAALNRAAELKVAAAYLSEHADDAPDSLQVFAACTDDPDLAANALIARLSDPTERGSALLSVQDYLDVTRRTARDQRHFDFHRAVRARPDVAQAIARVGRVQSWPVMEPPF